MQIHGAYNYIIKNISALLFFPFLNKVGVLILFACLFHVCLYSTNSSPAAYLDTNNKDLLILQEEEAPEEDPDTWIPAPAKSAMLSATLPGLGQIYNRKYWKVPIIYAGFGAVAYFLDMNSSNYQMYRKAYYYRVDDNPHTVDEFPNYSTDVLRRAMNYYRRNLEITYILGAALYILNILDASVDAHLMDFDISEDLSFRMEPVIERANQIKQPSAGLKLTINF